MNDLPLFAYVPYVRNSDTSRAAAESMAPHVSAIERAVLAAVDLYMDATCDEVEIETGLSHQTASARLRGLVLKGLVKDSGRRRNTRTGRKAAVYVAVSR